MILCSIINIYLLVLFARAILSWLPVSPDGIAARISATLAVVTEPVLAPVRARVPPIRLGAAGIDTAFLVVLLVLTRVVGTIVCDLLGI